MPKSAAITFIICTYNRADYLKDTIASLTQCDEPVEPVEILVIDNNSEDHTADVIKSYRNRSIPSISLHSVKEKKQGLSHARNRGIKEANTPVIVYVDDDIRAEKQYINAWLQFFKNHPDAQAAGGKIHIQYDDPRPQWMSRFLLPLLGHHDHGDSIKLYKHSDYPFGGNMAFKVNLFDHDTPFDTGLGRIGKNLKASEEKELFQSLKQKEIEIYYVPKAKLYHRVNASRLTREYVRRQAVGLGQSYYLQLNPQPIGRQLAEAVTEAGKWLATAILFPAYLIRLQPSKGMMLFRFRRWIAEGYASAKRLNGENNE